MAQITAQLVKQLREATDAGMLDCKKALEETDGDIDTAIEYLRKKGLSKAAKKADRIASEGSISLEISSDLKSATMTEINSETDFVSKNENFQNFVKNATCHIHATASSTVEELNSTTIDGTTFEEYVQTQIAKIGENIVVRRFAKVSVDGTGLVSGYVHSNGRVGTMVAIKCDSEATCTALKDVAKDISMHAAAMAPKYLNESQIPADMIEKEAEIAKEQLVKEGKPQNMLEKILPGKIKKFVDENTLVGQKFVKDDKKSVEQVLNDAAKSVGGKAELVDYVRFELGEGLEKRACNFAEEVAAQLQ
ncbi:MAG: translation elongation factor Ts [Campylobacterales bacterium]|nr:translation elongation factor Ts [Campylobacterales bacterium]